MKCPRGCGRDIVWHVDVAGKKVALENASVWHVRKMAGDTVAQPMRDAAYKVLHFAICPAPNAKPLALWAEPKTDTEKR